MLVTKGPMAPVSVGEDYGLAGGWSNERCVWGTGVVAGVGLEVVSS